MQIDPILTQKQLSKRLQKLYILALSAIALGSIIGQLVVQYCIGQQQSDAKVVNLAGRQRMLSQRLCKTAILLANPEIYLADDELYLQDLYDIIGLWEKVHQGLKGGMLDLGTKIEVRNSPKIDSMLRAIDPYFVNMISSAKRIGNEIETPSTNKKEIINLALKLMLQDERTFLKKMDKIVFQYESEANKRVQNLRTIELSLFIITMLALFMEGVFIFKPTYSKINQTINAISESEKQLQKTNEQLNIANDTLMKTKEELVSATREKYLSQIKEDKIRSVSLIEGQEEERKRLSQDLHDGIGQMLTAIKLMTEKFDTGIFQEPKHKAAFDDLKKLLSETISETRIISFNLMPSALNDFGIISAIRLLCEQFEKNSSVEIIFDHFVTKERLPKNIEITIYRIVQEALNNSIKHAQATTLNIHLEKSEKAIALSIFDNGKGFDIRKLKNNAFKNGLNNIKSRTEINNGEFKISSNSGKGTKILVKLPLGTHTYQ